MGVGVQSKQTTFFFLRCIFITNYELITTTLPPFPSLESAFIGVVLYVGSVWFNGTILYDAQRILHDPNV